MDLDISILKLDSTLYSTQFVAGGIWGRDGANLEITNAFFCLKRSVLIDIMHRQMTRILHGRPK